MATDVGRPAVATKLTYLVSHPIQYQAPLLRRIGIEEGIDLRVVFERKPAGSTYFDPGFGGSVAWDVPLTEGYDSVALADTDLRAEIRRADALWLHGWQSWAMRRALALAGGLRVPVLMRGENCDLAMPDGRVPRRWLKRLYVDWIFRRCRAFLAIGSENQNYYLRRGVPRQRIFSMPYAVDNEAFARKAEQARPRRDALKASIGIAPDRRVVLYVGKLLRRKRPDVLARAVAGGDWPNGKPALVFVGSGEMENELRAVAPDATFLGFKNQGHLPALYDMADVVALPSEREPWGLVVNEAMACGTAAVVSDQVGCAADLVKDGCGVVVPAGDAAALARGIARCLDDADAMGKAAAARIRGWSFAEDVEGLKRAIEFARAGDDGKA